MQTKNLKILTILQTHKVEECFMNLTLDNSDTTFMGSSSINSISPPSSSTLIGDYIGVESCLDLKNNDDIFESSSSSKTKEEEDEETTTRTILSKRDQRREMKEFPPPIPSLARTGNLHSRMPWVLRRYYTNDGRLILKEEKVRHHEYFRAHRCNGRLTLQLVPLDHEVYPSLYHKEDDDNENVPDHYCTDCEDQGQEEQEAEEDEYEQDNSCIKEEDVEKEDRETRNIECKEIQVHDENGGVDECASYVPSCNGIIGKKSNGVNGGNLSPFKCYNYNSARPSSNCIFGVPIVPTMRPVHS